MTELYAVYGVSGCGRSLMPVARAHLARLGTKAEIFFIDDDLNAPAMINGHRVVNYEQFKAYPANKKYALIVVMPKTNTASAKTENLAKKINSYSDSLKKSDHTKIT